MKKKSTIFILSILLVFLISNIFSTWLISFSVSNDLDKVSSNNIPVPVAYITTTSDIKNPLGEYTSIEKALSVANSRSDNVIVNVYLDAKTNGAKTISRNCVINSNVTLNVANLVDTSDSSKVQLQVEDSSGKMVASEFDVSLSNKVKNTVKIKKNVTIINNGTIVIGGELSGGNGGAAYCGQTSGDYGEIQLENNAKIISNGEIRCCGYITESTLNNGSSVEIRGGSLKIPFIIRDFRGGSNTIAIVAGTIAGLATGNIPYTDEKSPFNQFELRNIQCEYKVFNNGSMFGYSNIRINDEALSNTISFIGSSNSNNNPFFAITNTNGFVCVKYNINTQIMNYDFYGGAILNDIKIPVSMKVGFTISATISMQKVFFPLSWRVNISFYKLDNQEEDALYDASMLKIKLMPGAKITVNTGTILNVKSMNVYTYFSDKGGTISGTKYEIKEPAEFYVNGKFICKEDFGGRIIKGDNVKSSDINLSKSGNTTYEAYNASSTTMNDVLAIEEKVTIVNKSDFDNNKTLAIGVVKLKGGVTPSYSITVNNTTSGDLSGNSIYSIPTNGTAIPNLKTNIASAYYNGAFYKKSSSISITNDSTLVVNASSSNIGNISITSITVSGDSNINEKETGKVSATINPTTSYTKKVLWYSSDSSILTIDNNGNIKGIKEGNAYVYAISDDNDKIRSNDYQVQIEDPNAIHEIKTIKLICDNTTSNAGALLETTITASIDPSNYTAELYEFIWNYPNGAEILDEGINDDRIPYLKVSIPANNNTNVNKEYSISLTAKHKSDSSKDINSESAIKLIATAPAASCLIEGTLVTTATCKKVPVESLKAGDELLVFNHESGKLDIAPVLFNDSESESEYEIINLEFSNGNKVKVISEHGFFDLDLMKYVYIDAYNYKDFIGHSFYSIDNFNNKVITKLNKAYLTTERCKVYSPVTKYHLNYFVEDILSMPGGITGLFNIFDYNDDLKYDEETKNRDIEKYGLFTYDDFKYLVPLEMFNAFPTPYLKVAIGKGLLTWEDLYYYIERYGPLM